MRGIIVKTYKGQSKLDINVDGEVKTIEVKQSKKNKIKIDDILEGYQVEVGKNDMNGKPEIKEILTSELKPFSESGVEVKKNIENKIDSNPIKITKEKSKHRYAYNFISFNEEIKRTERVIGENTGTLSIILETLTPTSVEEFGENNYVIQGSSLKGVTRNLIEAISNSCFKNFKEEKYREFGGQLDFKNSFPKTLNACNTFNNTCYACNIFGTTDIIEKKEINNNVKEINKAQSSKLFFSDAIILNGKKVQKKILKPLLTPHAELNKYYFKNGKIAGRKVYFHHSDKLGKNMQSLERVLFTDIKKSVNSEAFVLDTGSKLKFNIDYKGLTDVEFGMLLFVLGYSSKFMYKIGRGKSLGMGSVKFTIDKIATVKDKYADFNIKKTDDNYIEKINIFLKEFSYIKNSIIKEVEETLTKEIDFKTGAYNRQNNTGIKIKQLPDILDMYY